MRDVAALAGVGIKTVSRVVNGEPHVSERTATRVEAAAAELGYEINQIAGNLRRSGQRTMTIGAIVGHIANPFSAEILGGMEEVLADRGYAVLSTSHDDDANREQRLVRDFLRRRVDGIVVSAVAGSQAYLAAELDRGYPIVFVDRTPTDVSADAVVGDNEGGAHRATQHLVDHGHRRIAVLCDATGIETARLRMAGHERALAANGIALRPEYVVRDVTSIEQARECVARLLALPEPPTALFAAQNLITIGAIRALRELGLEHAVALVSFDDIPLVDMLSPAVTVVTQHPGDIGRVAARRLLARLEGLRAPAEIIVRPTPLIIRGSGEIPPRI
ncbi:MAG: LacI family transcriptional regulator [Demequinaceae bacterium]|nr:LacI family transcriptional regulator [Demequinaceae bacterium]